MYTPSTAALQHRLFRERAELNKLRDATREKATVVRALEAQLKAKTK